MGTTAQKLNKILETKEAIRTAINNKGGTLTTTDTFASYPTAIDNLPSGGNDWLKEFLDETKDASYLFCGYASLNYGTRTTWCKNLTNKILQKVLKYETTSNVTNMSGMFYWCKKITTIPSINTSLVTNMDNMFRECYLLTTIPQLDTSKVTNMCQMFYYCSNLTTIPQLDTSKVTNIIRMFNDCPKLTTIDITHMNITSTSNSEFFALNCFSLTILIIRNMTTIPALNSNAFTNCYHFTGTTDSTYNPQGLKDGRIYVPDDKVDALKTASGWRDYADIIAPLSTLVE